MDKKPQDRPPPQDRPDYNDGDVEEFLVALQERQSLLVARMAKTQDLIKSLRAQKNYQEGIDIEALTDETGAERMTKKTVPNESFHIPYTPNSISENPNSFYRDATTPNMTKRTASMAELFSYLSLSQDYLSESNLKRNSTIRKSNSIEDPDQSQVVERLYKLILSMTPPPSDVKPNQHSTQVSEMNCSYNCTDIPKSGATSKLEGSRLDEYSPNKRDIADIISNSIIRGSIDIKDNDAIFSFLNRIAFALHNHFISRDSSFFGEKDLTTPARKGIRRRVSAEAKIGHGTIIEDPGEMADIDTDHERVVKKPTVVSTELFTKWNNLDEPIGNTRELEGNNRMPLEDTAFEGVSNDDAGEDGDIDSDRLVKVIEEKKRTR